MPALALPNTCPWSGAGGADQCLLDLRRGTQELIAGGVYDSLNGVGLLASAWSLS